MPTPKAPIEAPSLLHLVNTYIGSHDEDTTRAFFGIKRKPGPQWVETLRPGLEAAHRVLVPWLAEQSTGDAKAGSDSTERNRLCAVIFGRDNIGILTELAKQLGSADHLQLNFDKIEEGRFELRVSRPDSKPLPQAPAPAAEPVLKHEPEPVEGLVPLTGPQEGASEVENLVAVMRDRVDVEEGEPVNTETLLKAVAKGRWTRKVSMLLPCYGGVNPHVMYSFLAQVRKQPWMGVEYEADTIIQRARNLLVQRFLASKAEWAFFVDSDTIPPFGDPAFFYDQKRLCADPAFIRPEFTALMAVERMLKAGRTIVGGVYQARRAGHDAPLVIQPCLHPRHAEDRQLVEELRTRGPFDKVVQVGYVATGCAIIHRSVFRDIQNQFPERQPENEAEPFDFFGHDVGKQGEDISFCHLAMQAGHASFLDCGLWAAHLGTYSFFPQKLARH